MSSREHDGCSGPNLCTTDFDLEYVGREEITVPAGTFETDHYRFLLDHHPTEDLWCTTDGFLFVKITVGGYMNAHFDLIEYEEEYWFIGWEPLRAYLDPPRPSPVVEGLREEMYDIEVKLIADDLAVAAWRMHFEMKIRGKAPIGEDVRVSAVLRRKPEGWRYIHWAESPMTAMVYIEKLFQRDVDHEKFAPMIERARARRAAPQ